MSRTIAFCFFIVLGVFVHASPPKRFKVLTTENGLSSNWIRGITQDEQGFMWFCTSDGLNRYDGYNFRIFRPSDNTEYTLISGGINYMYPADSGKFWICTEQGISIFDVAKETFRDFKYLTTSRVNHCMKSSQGDFYFSTYNGLYKYIPETDSLVDFRYSDKSENSLAGNRVEMCYEDKRGDIWVIRFDGVDLIETETGKIYNYNPIAYFNKKGRANVRGILETDDGRILLSIENLGVVWFKNAGVRHERVEYELLYPGNASVLTKDVFGNLWVGNSLGGGIDVFKPGEIFSKDSKNPEHYAGIPQETGGILDNTISCIYEDQDSGIWLGTYAGGVNYYSPKIKPFEVVEKTGIPGKSISNNVVNVFLEDGDYFWIGTEEGLNRKSKDGSIKQYHANISSPRSLAANGILTMYKDSKGRLWIGTWAGGLSQYHYKTDDFTTYLHDPNNPESISNNNIFKIFEDLQGRLWIGTNGGGLNLFNPENGTFKHFMNDPYDSTSLFHDAINDICQLTENRLLISDYHSLEIFNPEDGTFSHFIHVPGDTFSLSKGNILDIFKSTAGDIWIGTSTGLHGFDPYNKTFSHYTEDDGLPNNTIQAILEDSEGNLWLSTNYGISKMVFSGKSIEFINFNLSDGLPSNQFMHRAALKSSEGLFYFGSPQGYVRFEPEKIQLNANPPEIAFIEFRLIGEGNATENISPFKNFSTNFERTIILSYEQADFELEFASLSYMSPEENQYKFMLDGYETNWHYAGNRRTATYTNIDPGEYSLKVLASNNDGVWSSQPRSLKIIIEPPWWRTWTARISFILLIVLIIYTVHKLRMSMVEKQKKVLEHKVVERTKELTELNTILEEKQEEITHQNEQLAGHRENLEKIVKERTEALEKAMKKAEEADRLKSAFLANMSHEIRTPMNAIVGFAAMLNEEDVSEEEKKEFSEIINNNSETLMVLINDILDISLIEANQLSLIKKPFNVSQILHELESFFSLKKKKDIRFEFLNRKDEELYLVNDQTRFRQIITNLLNNAYKYTEKGSIRFGYEVSEGEVKFFVQDTGIGIAEDEYENIFNYFHKIDKDDNKLYRGAGIGLSISNKLVELMGGRIWLESEINKGTTFYFTLPGNTFPSLSKKSSPQETTVNESLSGITVVVAEDETTNYILLERILKRTGANVIWAHNGLEAINTVNQFDSEKNIMVLMDIKMPVLNGITAATKIHELHKNVPIIAVTAYAHVNDKHEIMKHPFVDYIAKPIKSDILLKKINRHLNPER